MATGLRRSNLILAALLILMALAGGYLCSTIYPFHRQRDCHRLGGWLEAVPGPGKPLHCVIPWAEH